jgi:propanol-preferring alcohol dehydrogenase
MRAALLRQFGKPLSLEEVPTPVPANDEVLIEVQACGIDGTDLKLLDGFGYTPDLPFIMGHEVAGIVAELGPEAVDVKVGDRVIVYNFATCGRCPFCLAGREQLCPRLSGVVGVKGPYAGGYAQYLKVPARQVLPIPEGVSWPDAAVLPDAGLTAYRALQRARVRLGETVVVVGVGGVGSFAVQLAKLAGATVIAVEVSAAKAARALHLGADHCIDSSRQDVAEGVRRLSGERGVDCVLDIVGTATTLAAGVDSLAGGGRLVIVGYTPDTYALNGKRMAQNELEIIGTRAGSTRDLLAVARLAASGKISSIVTDLCLLEQVNEALHRLRSGQVLGRLVLQTAN